MGANEGWEVSQFGKLSKVIGSHKFHIVENDGIYYLRITGWTLATRPTLAECQQLAHDTAKLWRGEQ